MYKPPLFSDCSDIGAPDLLFISDPTWIHRNKNHVLEWCTTSEKCKLIGDTLLYIPTEELRTSFYLQFAGESL